MQRVAATICLIALVLPLAAQAHSRHWPRPPSWFVRQVDGCIELRESTDGKGSPNLYGMQAGWAAAGGTGWAGNATPTEQLYRAWRLYGIALRTTGDGWSPWTPYDGCY